MSLRTTVLLLSLMLALTFDHPIVAMASRADPPALNESGTPLLATTIRLHTPMSALTSEPAANAIAPNSIAHVAVEVWEDRNADGMLDYDLDAPYVASDFQLLLQVEVDNGLSTYEQEMLDSDDGLIDGRTQTDITGAFYVVYVSWHLGKLTVAPNYRDVSNTCLGPPFSPNGGCIHAAVLYDERSATLRLLVAPTLAKKVYLPLVVRSLPAGEATFRIGVGEE